MTYRSKYVDKINSRREFRKSVAATPVAASKRVPVLTKSFDAERKPRRKRRASAMATASTFYTCGPLSTWPIDEDGWHEDTYK